MITTDTPPTESGPYNVFCGNSKETFIAYYDAEKKLWKNSKGEEIALNRTGCGDMWEELNDS